MNPVETPQWWRTGHALHRFVCDLVHAELSRLRPGRTPPALPWSAQTRITDDLGADSLERLQIVTALAEAIHLHRAGIDDALLTRQTIGEWVSAASMALDVFSAELTFRTSGSTGHPRWHVHRLAQLRAEVDELAVILAGARRVIGTVPAHHIYGFLFTVLVPATLDLEFIDARAHAPAQLAQVLAPGDVVVGYPDFWRSFMRTVPRVPSAVTGVTSTGPCPAELARAVRAAGMARFIDMFGSSETAGIGWRDDADAPYELLPYWRRGAAEGELVRRESDGEQRAYAAPDRLIWSDERHFAPDGRIEGAVQVGGVNVYPERVAALLRSHPAVAGATVRLMRPEEGERLKAFIVPRSADADSDALVGMLWPWLEARLPPAERPKSIVVGESLPVTELGKSADWPIPGLSS